MSSILELEDVTKRFTNSSFALKGISFSIPYGSIVGFIGENGAGKTTTMGTIIGTLKKDDGVIRMLGKEVDRDQVAAKEDLGVVFDNMNFSKNLNAVQLGHVLSHIYQRWDASQYRGYLERFRLPTDKNIEHFSRGMSMKLSLAVALSHEAKVFILDEATAGLDPVGREEILEVLLDVVKDKDRGVLMSSHITSDIEKVADRLIFIKNGEILLNVSKDSLVSDYAILTCTPEEYQSVPQEIVAAYRKKDDGIDVLVTPIDTLPATFNRRPFSVDEVTLLLMRGETK
ncbi:ABC transporter ATP-binding protein [Paenibacillus daejeonensis]|uniref:ABC transporter ATP-binding protein n=1 Tax=Paenibacillus daejeonensis TaxID=135193 RepID=UPI00037D7FFA|nr:ABC transporter ATP-binding protein [Paenibacillus daejeonensis]